MFAGNGDFLTLGFELSLEAALVRALSAIQLEAAADDAESSVGRPILAANSKPPEGRPEKAGRGQDWPPHSALARLRALIEANDGEAVDALAEMEGALVESVDRTRLEALRKAVSEFEFEEARRRLDELIAQPT